MKTIPLATEENIKLLSELHEQKTIDRMIGILTGLLASGKYTGWENSDETIPELISLPDHRFACVADAMAILEQVEDEISLLESEILEQKLEDAKDDK